MFERTKGVIRSRKSKKVKQFNGQWISDKKTNNDLQDNEQENKYCETRTPQKYRERTRVLRNGIQFLLHQWHPSCHSYKKGFEDTKRVIRIHKSKKNRTKEQTTIYKTFT
jgi:hypothetical protein